MPLPQSTGGSDHGKRTFSDIFGTFHLHLHNVHFMFYYFREKSTTEQAMLNRWVTVLLKKAERARRGFQDRASELMACNKGSIAMHGNVTENIMEKDMK